MEFNAIGSGNWKGITFNRRSFQISLFYRTFGLIYILKSSVVLHFCRSGPTVFGKSGSCSILSYIFDNKICLNGTNEIELKMALNTTNFPRSLMEAPEDHFQTNMLQLLDKGSPKDLFQLFKNTPIKYFEKSSQTQIISIFSLSKVKCTNSSKITVYIVFTFA